MKRRMFLSTAAAIVLSTTGLMARGRGSRRKGSITEDQKQQLLYLYQEEKVARDVYTYFADLYPEEFIFARIARSEQWHMNAAAGLCNSYGIDISDIDESVYGEFVLPELQDLYDSLILNGSESLIKALYVGEAIEIMDIQDLQEAMASMPNLRNVQKVFGNLLNGSENHLEAFRSAINRVS